MSPTEAAAAVLAAALVAAMIPAAVSDIRTRRIPDRMWVPVLAAGIPLGALCASHAGGWAALAYAFGAVLLAAYALSPRLVGRRAAPVIAVAVALFAASALSGSREAVSAPAAFALMYGLHRAGLLTGGADAKCMMSLALALPSYPTIPGLPLVWTPWEPLSALMCPAMSVLLTALLLTLASVASVLVRNAVSGDLGRGMATTIPVPLSEADPDLHWPVEEMRGGAVARCRPSPETAERAIESMREAGAETVRVSPTVPFVAYAAAGLAFVLVLGCPAFVLA